ncbi:conjugal transfer protein TraF [Desulforhopalus sp. IMCC35007]|uniref:conjugal transfer protein TraF n=1 Tax=Desulforhopalus sp. IMCC35007 TaxID=2569543 RepID=UPI00145C65C3|nr:conjugal transfer protein TraF [Desulforhopalus sp. IMCC35007]
MQTRSYTKHCRSGNGLFGLLFCLVLCLIFKTSAEAGENTFYHDSKHGWFWYEDPPPEQEKEVQEIDQQPVAATRHIPSLDTYSIEELWNMHPDDFQQLLNSLQKKAVQTPTEQNILEYLTMQDTARRKALAYTNATMYVTQKYGELFNVNHVYPTAGPGVTARVTMQQNEISQTISRANNDHALIFFVAPGCGFCEKQAGILSYFVDKYGWPIKTVDISQNPGSAARFNITITPTLLLIKKGQDNYMTVASGVIALTELERKLYRAIRLLQGNTQGDNFLMYDFQKGSAFDPPSILEKGRQPWKRRE